MEKKETHKPKQMKGKNNLMFIDDEKYKKAKLNYMKEEIEARERKENLDRIIILFALISIIVYLSLKLIN